METIEVTALAEGCFQGSLLDQDLIHKQRKPDVAPFEVRVELSLGARLHPFLSDYPNLNHPVFTR